MTLFGLGMAGASTGLNIASTAVSSIAQQSNMSMQAKGMTLSAGLAEQRRGLEAANENYQRLQNLQNYSWAREKQLVQNSASGFRSNSATFQAANQLTLSRAMANDRMAQFNTEAQGNMAQIGADAQRAQARVIKRNAGLAQIAGILGMAGQGFGFMKQVDQYISSPRAEQ